MSEVTPVITSKSRIVALDVLRGVAILGILIPNIIAYGSAGAMSMVTPGSETSGTDAWVEVLRAVFVSGKFRGMLSILFGIGLAMQFQKLSTISGEWPNRYLRRTVLLMAIGAVHLYFIWFGDILFIYSIAALMSLAFVKVSDRGVLIGATIMIGVSVFFGLVYGALLLLSDGSGSEYSGILSVLSEANEHSAYATGSYLQQLQHRVTIGVTMLPTLGIIALEIVGGFLVGLLLGRRGVIAAPSEHPKIRDLSLWVGFGVGGLMSLTPLIGFLAGWSYNFQVPIEMGGGVLLGLGYVMFGAVVVEKIREGLLVRAIANVGRFALSCYLLQSVLLTSVFYSWGGGYYGKFTVSELLGFVVGTWVVLLVFAAVWARYFQFGPVEWLWRSLTYKKRLRIRKEPV